MSNSPIPWGVKSLASQGCETRIRGVVAEIYDSGQPSSIVVVCPMPGVAERIVRVVNMHDELVTMIERVQGCAAQHILQSPPPKIGEIHWSLIAGDCGALLAKAKGETCR